MNAPDRHAEVRLARAYLSAVATPPAPSLAALIHTVGPVQAASLVRQGKTSAEIATQRLGIHTEALLATLDRLGGRLIIPEDGEWCPGLDALAAPPPPGTPPGAAPIALWVLGTARLDELTSWSIAVTGARAATAMGDHVAADLAYHLAERGVAVVAGASFGIDAAAHRGALAATGGRGIAVQASGLDLPHPAAHSRMLTQIAERGLVVSEYPPGQRATRDRLLARTRLVAALAAATVVVEAGARSSSLLTASCASALGRAVMAVPGPVTSALSAGCHDLIRDGRAQLITGYNDVLAVVPPPPVPGGPRTGVCMHCSAPVKAQSGDVTRTDGQESLDECWRAPQRPCYTCQGQGCKDCDHDGTALGLHDLELGCGCGYRASFGTGPHQC